MIDTPHITSSPAQIMACIHLAVSRDEICHVMGPGITEVFSVLSAQGIKPTRPWFTHHSRRPTDTFDFRICVPIATPALETGRVKQGGLPARASVAHTVYSGPYETLGDA